MKIVFTPRVLESRTYLAPVFRAGNFSARPTLVDYDRPASATSQEGWYHPHIVVCFRRLPDGTPGADDLDGGDAVTYNGDDDAVPEHVVGSHDRDHVAVLDVHARKAVALVVFGE